jgi:hypothetical protein
VYDGMRRESAGPIVPPACHWATCRGLRFFDDARWCDVWVLVLFTDSPFIGDVGLASCREFGGFRSIFVILIARCCK